MTELDKEDAKGIKAAGLENSKPEEEDIVDRAVEIVNEGRKYGLKGSEGHRPLEDEIREWSNPSFNVHLGVFNRFSRYLLEEEEQEHYLSITFGNWRDLDLEYRSPSLKEQVEGSIVYNVSLSVDRPRKDSSKLVTPDEGMRMRAHSKEIGVRYSENQWDDLRNLLQEYAEEDIAAAWEEHPDIRMYAYKMEPNSG